MKTLPDVPNFPVLRSKEDSERAIRAILEYLVRLKNAIEPTLPANS